jgi:hypothetical protein
MHQTVDAIIKNNINDILSSAGNDFLLFQEKLVARMSTKLQSEIISALVEISFVKIISTARLGNGDHEADIYINDIPVELKTSRKSRKWRGGEFSKRSGNFLLISWDVSKNTNKVQWFVLHGLLEESDWQTSKSKNYYATTISLDEALQKNGNVIVGNIRKAKKLTHPIYEEIF